MTAAIITTIGTLAALVLWLLKFLYGKKAVGKKVIKWQEEVDAVTKQISQMSGNRRTFNFKLYSSLNARRKLLNRKIRRAKKLLNSRRILSRF